MEVPSDYSDLTSTVLTIDAEVNGKPALKCYIVMVRCNKRKTIRCVKTNTTRKKYELDTTALSLN